MLPRPPPLRRLSKEFLVLAILVMANYGALWHSYNNIVTIRYGIPQYLICREIVPKADNLLITDMDV